MYIKKSLFFYKQANVCVNIVYLLRKHLQDAMSRYLLPYKGHTKRADGSFLSLANG